MSGEIESEPGMTYQNYEKSVRRQLNQVSYQEISCGWIHAIM